MAKTRLQFEFGDDALQQLDELKGAVGAPSRAEVIRQALRLLQWTIEQTQDEKATVLVEKNGKQREVIFPYLANRNAARAAVRSDG
jgi:metal-responsive CopG/Arc/MetJ family transcriptional regulator